MPLLHFTKRGIYCEKGDFYIDPWKPVKKAVITHAHSDHARPGHKRYLCSPETAPMLRHRLGLKRGIEKLEPGQTVSRNGVQISFYPAGHIIGSVQVKVEAGGEKWVVSGDYKTQPDPLARAFEPVPCHHFITESTFGLPVYRWPSQEMVLDEMVAWFIKNSAAGFVSVISAYSLGKAQRLMAMLDSRDIPVFTHGAVEQTNNVLRKAGLLDIRTRSVTDAAKDEDFTAGVVVAPPSALGSSWMKRFKKVRTAAASGWMQLRGIRRRRGVDRGFVLSDHADWEGLNHAVTATGAENIYVTHGYTSIFSNWLKEQGLNAREVASVYDEENAESK